MAAWQSAVQRARDLDDASLPEVTGGGAYSGPPPPHRWGERFPDAAARLAAAREVVTALAEQHAIPAENLISPDAVRRVSWEPPDPADATGIAAALAGCGARAWQAGLVAPPVATAWHDLPPARTSGHPGHHPGPSGRPPAPPPAPLRPPGHPAGPSGRTPATTPPAAPKPEG